MIWQINHRPEIWGFGAFLLWMAAYYWYLRFDIRAYFRRRAPHRWGVDMEKRKITSGPKPLL